MEYAVIGSDFHAPLDRALATRVADELRAVAVDDDRNADPHAPSGTTVPSRWEQAAAQEVRSWSFVADVDLHAAVPLGKSSGLFLDMLLRARGRAPLAVVEVKSRIPASTTRIEDYLWSAAKFCKTPFAIITDGTDWRFYRADPDQGLVLIDGGFDAFSAEVAKLFP